MACVVSMVVKLTSERIYGYQDTSNIRVDLPISPSLLQVLVYAFVADGGEEGHVGHSDLFLLETFLPVRLAE